MRGPGTEETLRFAARIVADPANAVGQWRALTGGKAVGCVPPIPVPEILHAAGLLPVPCAGREIPPELRSILDAWVVAPRDPLLQAPAEGKPRFEFPAIPPVDLAEALDRLESLAEWAGLLSGRPVTEGNLWKSIRAYRERKELLLLLSGNPGESGNIACAGDFLPPEAHSMLLARFLRTSPPEIPPSRGEGGGDPLIHLARRLIA